MKLNFIRTILIIFTLCLLIGCGGSETGKGDTDPTGNLNPETMAPESSNPEIITPETLSPETISAETLSPVEVETEEYVLSLDYSDILSGDPYVKILNKTPCNTIEILNDISVESETSYDLSFELKSTGVFVAPENCLFLLNRTVLTRHGRNQTKRVLL